MINNFNFGLVGIEIYYVLHFFIMIIMLNWINYYKINTKHFWNNYKYL